MDKTLSIALLSLDVAWADPVANIKALERYMAKIGPQADIVALPELFTTAFIQDKRLLMELAETNSGPTITIVKQLARKYDCAISGSFSACDDRRTKVYNRAFFIEPDGRETYYDKRHLFTLSSESEIYTAGDTRVPVVSFRGWNVAMLVCYDIRFPVWTRNVDHRYDIMLVAANWPNARGYAWKHLIIARAIENQAIYVGADRSGSDDYGNYDGLAQIYDANGYPVGEELRDMPVIMAALSKEDLLKARKRLPVIDSFDAFDLHCNIK
ncbi:MAG: nitrilase family protein [Muribaculaceae bacterium]|nr:nitrilase family protein [Muribaculaceae bacterium]